MREPKEARDLLETCIEAMVSSGTNDRRADVDLLRVLRRERTISDTPITWPFLTIEERTQIVENRFRTGRYRQPGEPDTRPLVAERRSFLWRALAGNTLQTLTAQGRSVPGLLEAEALPPGTYSPRAALRCCRRLPPGVLRISHPGTESMRADMRRLTLTGELWWWCDEGWFTTLYDRLLSRGLGPQEALRLSLPSAR